MFSGATNVLQMLSCILTESKAELRIDEQDFRNLHTRHSHERCIIEVTVQ